MKQVESLLLGQGHGVPLILMEARCWLQIVSGKPATKFRDGYTLVAQVLDEGKNSARHREANQDGQSRFVISRKEKDDVISIDESEIGSDRITNCAAEKEGTEKLFTRVLQSTGCDEKGNERKRRRQNGRNRDGAESPFLEPLIDFCGPSFREPEFHRLLAALPRQSVSNVAAKDRAHRCHKRVIGPRFAVAGSQPDGQHVHAASQRDDRVVCDSQQNQAHAT